MHLKNERCPASLKLAALVLGCVITLPVTAQAPFGVTLSDQVISVDVVVDDTWKASLDMREGALATISIDPDATLAVSPALADDKTQVDLLLLELRGQDRSTDVDQLDILVLAMGERRSIEYRGHRVRFQPQLVTQRNFVKTTPAQTRGHSSVGLLNSFGRVDGNDCCVSCGSVGACAVQVITPCGSCYGSR